MKSFWMVFIFLVTCGQLTNGCLTPAPELAGQSRTWQMSRLPPELGPLAHASCYANDQRLIVWGGTRDDQDEIWNNRLGIYEKGKWTVFDESAGPRPRVEASATGFNDQFFIVGGVSPQGEVLSDSFMFQVDRHRWQGLGSPLDKAPRRRASLIGHEKRVWLYGGRQGNREEALNGIDLSNLTWFQLPLKRTIPSRMGHSALAIEGKLMIWGGWEPLDSAGRSKKLKSDGYWIDLSTGEVKEIPAPPVEVLSPRANMHTHEFAGEVYIWGGASEDKRANRGAVYRISDQSWTPLPPIPDARFEDLSHPQMTWIEGQGFLLSGGRFADGSFNQVVYLLSSEHKQWQALPWLEFPLGRIAHCFVFQAPDRVHVVGGLGEDRGGHLVQFDEIWTLSLIDP